MRQETFLSCSVLEVSQWKLAKKAFASIQSISWASEVAMRLFLCFQKTTCQAWPREFGFLSSRGSMGQNPKLDQSVSILARKMLGIWNLLDPDFVAFLNSQN